MVKQVSKRRQAVILMMHDAFMHIFGQMGRQRAVGAKQAKAVDRQFMPSRLVPWRGAGDGGGRKRQ